MAEETKSYEGIGGWLILPLIGLLFLPIRMFLLVSKDLAPIFTEGHWGVLTTPGSPAYHPLWAPLIIFECAGNTLFVIMAIALLVLFFRKSRLLPKLMISYLALNLLFVVGDYIIADFIPGLSEQSDAQAVGELARAFMGAAIWIPYFLVSKRVKETFVRPVKTAPIPSEAEIRLPWKT